MASRSSSFETWAIRVGLPQWAGRIDEDRQVYQLTRNIVDLLRGTEPKIRTPPAN